MLVVIIITSIIFIASNASNNKTSVSYITASNICNTSEINTRPSNINNFSCNIIIVTSNNKIINCSNINMSCSINIKCINITSGNNIISTSNNKIITPSNGPGPSGRRAHL